MSRRIAKAIKEEIIGKVRAGERVVDLAEQYAVSTKTIYGWLRQDSGEGVVSVLDYNKLSGFSTLQAASCRTLYLIPKDTSTQFMKTSV